MGEFLIEVGEAIVRGVEGWEGRVRVGCIEVRLGSIMMRDQYNRRYLCEKV